MCALWRFNYRIFSMAITNKQIKFLREKCHHIKPVVTIGGAGLTENVMSEVELALSHHELVKMKINTGDRDERKTIIDKIVAATGAALVQTIGHTASFYRKADEPIIKLPNV